jgi:hypothetical protein
MKRSRAAGAARIAAANPIVPITCRLFITLSLRLMALVQMPAKRSPACLKSGVTPGVTPFTPYMTTPA